MNGFAEKTIEATEDFYKCQEAGWVYRGQRDSKKELKTTLERACENYGHPREKTKENEERLLREFQRKYHHYLQHEPDRPVGWAEPHPMLLQVSVFWAERLLKLADVKRAENRGIAFLYDARRQFQSGSTTFGVSIRRM